MFTWQERTEGPLNLIICTGLNDERIALRLDLIDYIYECPPNPSGVNVKNTVISLIHSNSTHRVKETFDEIVKLLQPKKE